MLGDGLAGPVNRFKIIAKSFPGVSRGTAKTMTWTPQAIAALCTGIVAILGAAGGAIAQFRHASNPAAHGGQGHPPAAPAAPPAPPPLS